MARVKIDIAGDKSHWDRTLAGASKGLDAFKSKVGLSFGTAFAGMAGGGTIAAMADNMATFAANVKRGAENMGITTKRFQELRIVAKHAGKDVSEFSGIFARANKFGADAQRAGSKQANVAKKLGLTNEDLHNLSTDALIKKALKGTEGMGKSTATNLLKDIVGKGGSTWLLAHKEEYMKGGGPVVGDSELNKMADLKEAFEDLIDVLRTVLIPAFIKAAEWLLSLIGGYAKGTKQMDDLNSEAESSYMSRHGGKASSVGTTKQIMLDVGYQERVALINAGAYGGTKEEKEAELKRVQRIVLTKKYDAAAAEEAMKNTTFTADDSVLGKLSQLQDKWQARAEKRKKEQAEVANEQAGPANREASVSKSAKEKAKSFLDSELKGGNNPFLKIGGLMGTDASYRLQRIAEKTNQILADIYKVLVQQSTEDDQEEPDTDQY